MSGLVPNDSEPLLLGWIRNGLESDQARLRLFKNDFQPDDDTKLEDLEEADFAGYAGQALTEWDVIGHDGQQAVLTHPPKLFRVTEVADPPDVAHGYYVALGSPADQLVWVERFVDENSDPAPITFDEVGKAVAVSPRLTLRSALPLPPAPETLLFDTFTDADETDIAAHTMDLGGGWTVINGTFTIRGTQLEEDEGGKYARATADAGQADVAVSANVTSINEGGGAAWYAGVAVRLSGNDGWGVAVRPPSSPGQGGVGVYRFTGVNGATLVAQGLLDLTSGTSYALRVEVKGDVLRAFLDGTEVVCLTMGELFAGNTGVGVFADTSFAAPTTKPTIDNFLVETL
ncbi:MAG: hypothetical protein L0Z62_47030 [Gemmataceae bacterium]|nr:hypothetical protein [Gemmataceae bacterium]